MTNIDADILAKALADTAHAREQVLVFRYDVDHANEVHVARDLATDTVIHREVASKCDYAKAHSAAVDAAERYRSWLIACRLCEYISAAKK